MRPPEADETAGSSHSQPIMFYTYIIQNPDGILYKGSTENLEKRIKQHNAGHSRWTKNKGPWKVVYKEKFNLKSEALKREKFFKSGKGRAILKKIVGA